MYITFETNTYGFVKLLPTRNSKQADFKEKTLIVKSKTRVNVDPFILTTLVFTFSGGKVRIC